MHAFSMYFLVRMHSRILCHAFSTFSAMQLPVAHTYDRRLIEREWEKTEDVNA